MIGLPSLHALDGAPGPRIWLAAEASDMRCGFSIPLAEFVQFLIMAKIRSAVSVSASARAAATA